MADEAYVLWILGRFESEHRRSFPLAGLKMVKKSFLEAPEAALEKAFEYYVLCGRFPSPEQLRDQVEYQTKEIRKAETQQRELEWTKTKGGATREELNRAGSIFTRQQQESIGRDAVNLLKSIISGGLTKQMMIDRHSELADKYHGSGFAYTAKEQKDLLRVREHWRPLAEAPPRFRIKMGYVETDELQ